MAIVDFINDMLYNNIKINDMESPTGVLVYGLLKGISISEDKQQLARATMARFYLRWYEKAAESKFDKKVPAKLLK